jgi:enoyl-CoA hydratase/carnithine racemase
LERAVEWIVNAKELSSEEGLKAGLIDEIAPGDEEELTEEEIVDWTSSFLNSDRWLLVPSSPSLIFLFSPSILFLTESGRPL